MHMPAYYSKHTILGSAPFPRIPHAPIKVLAAIQRVDAAGVVPQQYPPVQIVRVVRVVVLSSK